MRIKNKYSFDLIIQTLVILLVVIIFKLIEERRLAALVAGLLFIAGPLFLAVREYQTNHWGHRVWWFGFFQFYFGFSLPIFIGRIIFWNQEFENITLIGVPLSTLHRFSSGSYSLMMLMTAISYWRYKNKKAA